MAPVIAESFDSVASIDTDELFPETDDFFIVTMNDGTGRNLTHKAVIGERHDLLAAILRRDVNGTARTSRDVVSGP